MQIGVPREIKNHEYRVGMVPSAVHELTNRGHTVLLEKGAGLGIGVPDQSYTNVGATLCDTAEEVFKLADMIVKVKEPQLSECAMLREGQLLFTYLHLAPDLAQAKALCQSGCTAIAYETVTDSQGRLPLLTPMSEIAGRLAIQAGAKCLERTSGGEGILLGGVPGVLPANVVVIGGGVVGTEAVRMALGLEANVTVFDRSLPRLRALKAEFGGKLKTAFSTTDAIEAILPGVDLLVGAVLIPGASAPKVIKKEWLQKMKRGSVFVDVAIDQGGCAETSKATTYSEPTYIVDDVVHYCVANMPGAVPKTAAYALNNATLPFILALADKGTRACVDDPGLLEGLNVHQGHITHQAVAEALGLPYQDALTAIA